MFVEYCEYCQSPPFFDLEVTAQHYLQNHLKLLPITKNDMLIRKAGKFMEFSIEYKHHSNVYDFKNSDKVIGDFIENVARHLSEAEGEFRLICCIVNQSVVELHGRRLYTNSCFTTGIIEGSMNSRVKEYLFNDTKKNLSKR